MTATRPPIEIESELARVSRAYQKAEGLRVRRDELIREALAAGWPQTRISELTGVTRARIGQLAADFPGRKNQRSKR
jgi:hypothetical protein